jgi:hypothetical protein
LIIELFGEGKEKDADTPWADSSAEHSALYGEEWTTQASGTAESGWSQVLGMQ